MNAPVTTPPMSAARQLGLPGATTRNAQVSGTQVITQMAFRPR
jgi:hypothetical protein